MSKIRIATFNVNSVRSRMPILERWLPSSEVDVLCLQETKVTDADFPAAAFEAMGYKPYYCGEKSYNGVAVIARIPVDEVRFGFADGEEPDFPTRVAMVKTGGIVLLNTYVIQGKEMIHKDYELKKRFLERVRAFLEREIGDSMPFAWLGDINVAPTEMDLSNPAGKKDHVCFSAEIREKYEWVRSWGLTDLLRSFHPDAGIYTFFDYRVKDSLARNIGWRIDHILANSALVKAALSCYVDREPRGWDKPSDHTPLIADFDLKSHKA